MSMNQTQKRHIEQTTAFQFEQRRYCRNCSFNYAKSSIRPRDNLHIPTLGIFANSADSKVTNRPMKLIENVFIPFVILTNRTLFAYIVVSKPLYHIFPHLSSAFLKKLLTNVNLNDIIT